MVEADLVKTLLDYGLAGVVILLLFKLVFRDLHDVRSSLVELNREVREATRELRELREDLRRLLERERR